MFLGGFQGYTCQEIQRGSFHARKCRILPAYHLVKGICKKEASQKLWHPTPSKTLQTIDHPTVCLGPGANYVDGNGSGWYKARGAVCSCA